MIRRSFLIGTAALAGCTAPTSLAAWASDAATLAAGLSAILQPLGSVAGVPQSAIDLARSGLSAAAGFASDLAKQADPSQATSLLTRIENGVNSALSAVSPFMGLLPPPVGEVLMAAQVLLPVIEAAVSPATARKPAAGPVSPAAARLVLRGAAAKG